MGLFSKIFDKGADAIAKGITDTIANAVNEKLNENHQSAAPGQLNTQKTESGSETSKTTAVSGRSWGDVMPAEENQYSFAGSYDQYFDNIFRSEFSQYTLYKETDSRKTVFTFMNGNSKCLVVELLSRKSSAKKLRSDCQAEGIPYLRYYYDYHGWWNTRSYVVERTRKALG